MSVQTVKEKKRNEEIRWRNVDPKPKKIDLI